MRGVCFGRLNTSVIKRRRLGNVLVCSVLGQKETHLSVGVHQLRLSLPEHLIARAESETAKGREVIL